MPGRQAKINTPTMLRRMLSAVAGRQTTKRNRVIILLSAKAGLRACEIARLELCPSSKYLRQVAA